MQSVLDYIQISLELEVFENIDAENEINKDALLEDIHRHAGYILGQLVQSINQTGIEIVEFVEDGRYVA